MSAAINLRPALAQRESPVRLSRRPAEMPAAHLGAPEAISAPTSGGGLRPHSSVQFIQKVREEEDDLPDLRFVTGNAETLEVLVAGCHLAAVSVRWACPE